MAQQRTTRWDARVIVGALLFLSLVAWLFVIRTADGDMAAVGILTQPRSPMHMPMSSAGAGMALGFFISTWVVMMIAMMFPAAAPVVLLFDRWRRTRGRSPAATFVFIGGYLLVWTSAGILAYAALMLLQDHVMNTSAAARVGGGVLLVAGIYQLSALKAACLTQCRSPLTIVMTNAAQLGRGLRGPFRVGLSHGAYCFGCCWGLMAVLLALGMMHLGWMAAVAGLILVEKVLPVGPRFSKLVGVGFALAGVAVLATGSALPF